MYSSIVAIPHTSVFLVRVLRIYSTSLKLANFEKRPSIGISKL